MASSNKKKKPKSKQPPLRQQSKAPKPTRSPLLPVATCAVLLLITWFAFSRSMECEFTNWDDPTYVTENALVQGGLSGDNLTAIWSEDVSLNYHPLTIYSLAVNYKKAGLEPRTYHRTNVIFHVLNTLLVFIFFYLLSGRKLLVAAIVALFFGIHPMHVESVTWISERKDVLYTFFFVGALIAYWYFLKLKSPGTRVLLYVACLVLFVASCLSKAMAVVLPLILVLIDFYLKRKFTLKRVLEKVPFLLASVVFGVMALQIQSKGAVGEFAVFTVFERLQFASYGAVMYIVKLFAPVNLSAFYPYPNLTASGGLPVIFLVMPFIFLVIVAATIWSLKRTRAVFFGVMFYFVTVALVLQFISVGNAIIADRYTYVPYLGLLFPIAMGVWHLGRQKRTKILQFVSMAALAVAAVVFINQTRERTMVWKNSETLWSDVIAKYPARVPVAYKNRGNYYGQGNKLDEAIRDYEVFLQVDKSDPQIYLNIGNVYNLIGQRDNKIQEYGRKAIAAYSEVLAKGEDKFSAYHNRANTYGSLGIFDSALADYESAHRLRPDDVKLRFNRATTLSRAGRHVEAIEEFNSIGSAYTSDFNLYLERGRAYFMLERYPESVEDFESVLRLDPKSGPATFNIAVAAYRMNDFSKALDFARKARALGHPVDETFMGELETKANPL